MAASFDIEAIVLDPSEPVNLHRQLYRQLRGLIEKRALASGVALPSTRFLAKDLGIGRNSVIAAYDQLALEGYLRMRKGAPPVVVDLPAHGSIASQPRAVGSTYISARGKDRKSVV